MNADDPRYDVSRDKFAPEDDEHPLAKTIRSVLPSKPVLHQGIMWTNFVTYG